MHHQWRRYQCPSLTFRALSDPILPSNVQVSDEQRELYTVKKSDQRDCHWRFGYEFINRIQKNWWTLHNEFWMYNVEKLIIIWIIWIWIIWIWTIWVWTIWIWAIRKGELLYERFNIFARASEKQNIRHVWSWNSLPASISLYGPSLQLTQPLASSNH